MFPGDDPVHADDLVKQLVQRCFALFLRTRLFQVYHDVNVDVAVAGVSETGDSHAVFFLKFNREGEQFFQAATRHNDVFIQFGQPGVAQ